MPFFDFTYFFLNISLLVTFIIAGINVTYGHCYWKNALVCSLLFVLIQGTRYQRGVDYLHYVEIYAYGQENQMLFKLFNDFLKQVLGVGKYYIFYFYAIPFILSGFKLLKHFKVYAKYTFPFFLCAMLFFEETFIRQALCFSVVFLFLSNFIDEKLHSTKRIIFCSLCCLCIMMIHSANILFVILFLIVFYTCKKVISYKVSIPLLVFCAYFFIRFYDISYIMPVLNALSEVNPLFRHYVQGDAADAWFGEDAYQLENKRNPLILACEIIGNASLFYFSYKTINNNSHLPRMQFCKTMTNLYIIGLCGRYAFLYLELLNRLFSLFQRMWFIPLAIVLAQNDFNRLSKFQKLMYISMIFVGYDYLKYLFFPSPGMTLFLWDNLKL